MGGSAGRQGAGRADPVRGDRIPLIPIRAVVLSGCSGGGKSTLVEALAVRGFAIVAEPGRRVVREGLSWVAEPRRFAERLVAMARADLAGARDLPGPVFFDRGLIDAAVALEHAGGPSAAATLDGVAFDPIVFMVPPWSELYRSDAERPHGFDAALQEYARLEVAYPALGYRPIMLERGPVEARVDAVLSVVSNRDRVGS